MHFSAISSAFLPQISTAAPSITELLLSLSDDIPRPIKVQIKITNLDKRQIQLYQRAIR